MRIYKGRNNKPKPNRKLTKCNKCRLEWYYTGKSKLCCECPRCRARVKIS